MNKERVTYHEPGAWADDKNGHPFRGIWDEPPKRRPGDRVYLTESNKALLWWLAFVALIVWLRL